MTVAARIESRLIEKKKSEEPEIGLLAGGAYRLTADLRNQGLRDFSPEASAISAMREPLIPTQEFLVSGYLSE